MNNEQIPALRQAVENMANMREAYDNLSQAAEAYNVGKTQLAQAITAKGVETSPTESYPEMAEKVNAISQETYEINGGEMYAKQLFGALTAPNYWNLYEVLANLLSDGRLVQYGGILLAEYYRGYDSLALSGAGAGGAYVVSDKDSGGNFIMYTNDTTHTWDTEDDGKGNRWVAYCFADAGHDFDITDTNTSPRSIHIGRSVGTITSLVNGRVSEIIICDGNTLNCFNSENYTQNFGKSLILRNIKNQINSIFPATSTECSYVDVDKINADPIFREPQFYSCIIKANKIEGCLFGANKAQNLKYLNILLTSDERSSFVFVPLATAPSAVNLKCLSITAENLYINYRTDRNGGISPVVYLNYITNNKVLSVDLVSTTILSGWDSVTDLILQDGWCKPLNIIGFTALTKANVQDHIFDRLGVNDLSTGAVTITLASAVLNLFTQEEIDAVVERTNITIVGA